jgi:Tfp pilus assembly protein PilF
MRLRAILFLLVLTIAGCGGSGGSSQVASSEASVDAGLKAFEERRWEEAEQQLSTAIGNGGLQPDLAEAAMRSLAVCRIRLGKLEEAKTDLQQLQQGATEMDLFWLASAELAIKQGDTVAAKKAIAEARKCNSSVKLSEELQKVR